MTETRLFAIFDTKAQLFLDFFKSTNSDTATREFKVAVNGEGIIARFPEDYVLFEIGEFVYKTGQLIPFEPHKSICNGTALIMHDEPMQNASPTLARLRLEDENRQKAKN